MKKVRDLTAYRVVSEGQIIGIYRYLINAEKVGAAFSNYKITKLSGVLDHRCWDLS
jgi:hypothetical protein